MQASDRQVGGDKELANAPAQELALLDPPLREELAVINIGTGLMLDYIASDTATWRRAVT